MERGDRDNGVRKKLMDYCRNNYGREDEYIILENKITLSKRVKVKHNKESCGHEFTTTIKKMLEGKRCFKCHNVRKGMVARNRKPESEFLKQVKESNKELGLREDEYVFLEEYRGRKTKIKIKHNKKGCMREYSVRPGDFLRGNRCARCAGKEHKTTEIFLEEIRNVNREQYGNEDEYVFTGEYKQANTKMGVKHNIEGCGHEYEISPATFLNLNSRCPRCKYSKGEKAVERELKKLGVGYEGQYKLTINSKTKYWLRADFAVISSGKVVGVIEYDGKQHFEPVEHFGGVEEHKKCKIRDRVKNKYCDSNDIPILRIPYWEFESVENKVKDFIEKLRI